MTYLHDDKDFYPLLDKIHDEHGVDLTEYRPKCLGRRIYSRLRATGNQSIKDYVLYLDRNPHEYKLLMDTVTINVTQFFRNAEAFEAIKERVLPELIERKKKQGKKILRVWSAGCASGEETYTLAILLSEFLGKSLDNFTIKIDGTDIDQNALSQAIEGIYGGQTFKEMPPILKQKYFLPMTDGRFVVSDKIRLMTKFVKRDLVKQAPLEHMDMILCRNVVIYFSRELTHKIYASFYQSLNDKGYLILGKVEALWGEVTRYFKAVDNRERIYQRIV